MSSSWDLRTNIGPKPSSQGSLFRVADKSMYSAEKRYPRGYTPERQREVQQALPETIMGGTVVKRTSPEDQAATGRFARYPEAEARVRDTIARSSIPAEHLKGLDRIHGNVNEGTAGTYWPARRELAIDLKSGSKDTQEAHLIHELGHHHSEMTGEGRLQSSTLALLNGGAPSHAEAAHRLSKGVEEAYADDYAEEHYRPHPAARKQGVSGPKQVGGTYDSRFPPSILNERYAGYTQARPNNKNLGPQWSEGTLF